MKKIPLKVAVRKKEKPKRLRREGFVPGIVYGGHEDPLPIKIKFHDLIHLLHTLHGEKALVELQISQNGKEKKEAVILKEVQHDPMFSNILHVDFQRVSMKETLEVEVPIIPVGEAKGVKEGGILEMILRQVRVEALPTDLPEHIEVEITHLGIGDTLHVKDLKIPEGVKILTPGEETILTIVPPKVVEEKEAVEEAVEEKEEEVEEEKEVEEKEE